MNISVNTFGDIDCTARKIRGLAETAYVAIHNTGNEPCHIDDTLYLLYELSEILMDSIDSVSDGQNREDVKANRQVQNDIEKMEKLLEKSDKYDMTTSEMYYLKDTYPDLVELLHATYLFGYAQGMKGGE